jgi:hypothetical protein
MKENEKDDGLKLFFQSLDKPSAPFGLDDRIMKAVEAEHIQQKAVRKNLRLALAGVAASFVLTAFFVFGAKTFANGLLQRFSLEGKGLSDLISISLIFIGMLFLFLEMELVVKYWLHKHFARQAR